MPAPCRLMLAAAVVVAACTPAPQPGPVVVAPAVAPWTCAEQRQAAAELKALPAGAVVGRMMGDYGRMRDESRAALGLPKPAPCP